MNTKDLLLVGMLLVSVLLMGIGALMNQLIIWILGLGLGFFDMYCTRSDARVNVLIFIMTIVCATLAMVSFLHLGVSQFTLGMLIGTGVFGVLFLKSL